MYGINCVLICFVCLRVDQGVVGRDRQPKIVVPDTPEHAGRAEEPLRGLQSLAQRARTREVPPRAPPGLASVLVDGVIVWSLL